MKCNPKNIIFIPGECYETSPKFSQKFLDQFGTIITVQREIKHKNIIYSHNANPWFIGKSFDELISLKTSKKTKLISVISSNKSFTEGHKKRLDFVKKLKDYYGDKLDIFGRGINDFDDKWEVLANYKYSIAIENDFCEDWVTEKFFDCLYAHTLSFYYGCPNLEAIVNEKSFIRINIDDFEDCVKIIDESLKNEEFEKRIEVLQKESLESLNRDQFFPFLEKILNQMDDKAGKKNITIQSDSEINKKNKLFMFFNKIKQKIIAVK